MFNQVYYRRVAVLFVLFAADCIEGIDFHSDAPTFGRQRRSGSYSGGDISYQPPSVPSVDSNDYAAQGGGNNEVISYQDNNAIPPPPSGNEYSDYSATAIHDDGPHSNSLNDYGAVVPVDEHYGGGGGEHNVYESSITTDYGHGQTDQSNGEGHYEQEPIQLNGYESDAPHQSYHETVELNQQTNEYESNSIEPQDYNTHQSPPPPVTEDYHHPTANNNDDYGGYGGGSHSSAPVQHESYEQPPSPLPQQQTASYSPVQQTQSPTYSSVYPQQAQRPSPVSSGNYGPVQQQPHPHPSNPAPSGGYPAQQAYRPSVNHGPVHQQQHRPNQFPSVSHRPVQQVQHRPIATPSGGYGPVQLLHRPNPVLTGSYNAHQSHRPIPVNSGGHVQQVYRPNSISSIIYGPVQQQQHRPSPVPSGGYGQVQQLQHRPNPAPTGGYGPVQQPHRPNPVVSSGGYTQQAHRLSPVSSSSYGPIQQSHRPISVPSGSYAQPAPRPVGYAQQHIIR